VTERTVPTVTSAEEFAVNAEYEKRNTNYNSIDLLHSAADIKRAEQTLATMQTVQAICEELGIDYDKLESRIDKTSGLMGTQEMTSNGYLISWLSSGRSGLTVRWDNA
jgi:hypothetical protein